MKFHVQNELRGSPMPPPSEGPHPMAEDLVGTHVILERGSRPTVVVLGVYDTSAGVRCFSRLTTGPAAGTTAAFPLAELGPLET